MTYDFILSVLRMATPLLFAAMGGLLSERSGVINIALEGLMLVGAFVAAVATLHWGSPAYGFLAAGAAGFFAGLFYAFTVIHGRAGQIVAGTAFNLLAVGLIPLLLKMLYDSTGGTPALPAEQRFQYFPLWFVFVVGAMVWLFITKIRAGLWVSVAGENPDSLDAAGVSVAKVRYFAVGASGMLAALGGASLSIFLASGYSRNMVAGRGFMALAALILGKWRPPLAVLACLFFGLTEALQIRLQGAVVGGMTVPAQLVQIIPYFATIVVLAGFVGQAKPPKALGRAL
ncbi:MAG TPA: ABC transporter permease [Bdellovibrionota bacterium]|jgi:simple sugar transport system permease protein